MKLLILSDLHLELGNGYTVPDGLDYDAVALAGDIHCPGTKGVQWAQLDSTFGGRPVVYVPGNHEFYGREVAKEFRAMRDMARGSNVRVLDRDEVEIGGVRFLGATLWTDFALPIEVGQGQYDTDIARALLDANRRLSDFRVIELEYVDPPGPTRSGYRSRRRRLTAEDTLAMHWLARDWLHQRLGEPFAGPTVVVTHHAPARGSVAARYAADWLTPAFVSELSGGLFQAGVSLWIHGHTHAAFDYVHEGCRVVSNPLGYRMRDASFENALFDRGLVVEVRSLAC